MSILHNFTRLQLLSNICLETTDRSLAIDLKIKLIQLVLRYGEIPLNPELVDIYNRALNLDSKLSRVIVTVMEEETSLLLE